MPSIKFTTEILLEFIVLTLLESHSFSTSEISKKLIEIDFTVSNGTLHPLIAKLNHKDFIRSFFEEMDIGRAQKCHSLTEHGTARLKELKTKWRVINTAIYKAGK